MAKTGITNDKIMNNSTNRETIIATANNLRWEVGDNLHDTLMESIYENATEIYRRAVVYPDKKPAFSFDRTLDKILTSKYLGFPIMFLILGIISGYVVSLKVLNSFLQLFF